MNVFIYPLRDARIIKQEWLKELFPDVDVKTSFTILQDSVSTGQDVFVGAFDTKTKEIKGFLWGVGNPLDITLFVNSIFVDKSCRRNPKIIGTLFDYIKEHYQEMGYKKIFFMTKKPNFFLKRGCQVFEETCITYEKTQE